MDWETWKKWESIFREKSGNFEETGKVGILPKILEKWGNFTENTGKVKKFQPVITYIFFSKFLIQVYSLNRFLYLLNSLNKYVGTIILHLISYLNL